MNVQRAHLCLHSPLPAGLKDGSFASSWKWLRCYPCCNRNSFRETSIIMYLLVNVLVVVWQITPPMQGSTSDSRNMHFFREAAENLCTLNIVLSQQLYHMLIEGDWFGYYATFSSNPNRRKHHFALSLLTKSVLARKMGENMKLLLDGKHICTVKISIFVTCVWVFAVGSVFVNNQ